MIVSDESKYNSSIFFILAGFILSIIVIHLSKTRSLFYQLGNKIPGPPPYPLIGNAHLTLGKNHNQILEEAIRYSEIYGDVIRGWLGYKLIVFLMNPSDVGVILESSTHLDKSDEYRFFKPWLGDGLLISSGDLWRRHRKMIAPTFHQNILKSFIGTFYEHSCIVVDVMKEEIGKEFDVHEYMSKTTVDILLETAMGTKNLVKGNEGYKYAKSVMEMCDIIHKRTYNPILRLDFFYNFSKMKKHQETLLNTIHRLTEAVVESKKKQSNLNHEENSFVNEVVTNSLRYQPKKVSEKSSGEYKDDLDEIDNEVEIMEFALELSKQFGNIARAWIGNKLIVFLTNPSDVELILGSSVHLDKSDEYRFFKPWLGDGLLISSGDLWKRHRKMIAPTFHQNVLKSFIGTFYENSCSVVDAMKKEIGKEFDVHDYMSETTVDILLETAMGTKKTAQNNQGYDYAMAVMKMCDIIHKRTYNILYRWDTFFDMTGLKKNQEKLLDIIHGLTKRVIKTKNELYDKTYSDGSVPSPSLNEIIMNDLASDSKTTSFKSNKGLRDDLDDIDDNDVGEKRRLAFLDLMIEAAKSGANLTDDEIKDEVNTIMFEGHDTTAAASSFCLCLLGIHQDIQEKVQAELKGIFGDSDRPPNFADTLEMKYLERVIMETLRMYPPVPIIARKVNEDVKIVSEDLIIPKDTTVVIGTYKIHRRPDIYSNPDKFDPDNFLPERTQGRHYYSFIPFSAGPRSCVGRKYAMLKLKVLLSTILRRYQIISDVQESDFKLQGDIILKRTDGFRIRIKERQ